MDPNAARDLAQGLMQQHGLAGWTFRFDRARRRFGSCAPGRKTITLSKWLTLLNDAPDVRETILHEIAHALTPGDGHGRKWREACLRVGAKPVRCYDAAAIKAPPRRPARFLLGCKACDWWAPRHRLARRRLVCRACRGPVVLREPATGREFTLDGKPLATP